MDIKEKQHTMFVGVDVHKDTHTAVGISATGDILFKCTVGNYQDDFRKLIAEAENAAALSTLIPRFGLEDCTSYGARLAAYLCEHEYQLVHVPPIMVDRVRKNTTHPEKSDSLDALGVAKVMVLNTDTLPAYTVSESSEYAKRLKWLSHDRAFLVAERTRIKNQLHGLLHTIYNTEYKTYFKDPFSLKALRYWMRARPQCDVYLCRTFKRKARRLLALRTEIKELETDMEAILSDGGYTLHTASGCGVVLASTLIGEIGDITRFKTSASLAKYAGCAPKEHSSGTKTRHRKTRSGNRRLNYAFHRMALAQISRMGNEVSKRYVARKQAEGKSKQQALVCLRRQMVNVVFMMLKHNTEFRYPQ